jgi:DNA gyrase/topoisomerase IV subunit A
MYLRGDEKVVLINSLGVSITFPSNEVRVTGRAASGVRLMDLNSGTKVVGAALVSPDSIV